jgi:hypothetical protein
MKDSIKNPEECKEKITKSTKPKKPSSKNPKTPISNGVRTRQRLPNGSEVIILSEFSG